MQLPLFAAFAPLGDAAPMSMGASVESGENAKTELSVEFSLAPEGGEPVAADTAIIVVPAAVLPAAKVHTPAGSMGDDAASPDALDDPQMAMQGAGAAARPVPTSPGTELAVPQGAVAMPVSPQPLATPPVSQVTPDADAAVPAQPTTVHAATALDADQLVTAGTARNRHPETPAAPREDGDQRASGLAAATARAPSPDRSAHSADVAGPMVAGAGPDRNMERQHAIASEAPDHRPAMRNAPVGSAGHPEPKPSELPPEPGPSAHKAATTERVLAIGERETTSRFVTPVSASGGFAALRPGTPGEPGGRQRVDQVATLGAALPGRDMPAASILASVPTDSGESPGQPAMTRTNAGAERLPTPPAPESVTHREHSAVQSSAYAPGTAVPAAPMQTGPTGFIPDPTTHAPTVETGDDPLLADVPASEPRTAPTATTHMTAPGQPRHDIGRNIAVQIAEVVAGTQERIVELKLHPEELGRVSMTLSHEGGALTVALSADRADTLDLMRRHIDMLGEELRRLGYSSVGFSFGDGRQERGAAGSAGPHSGATGRDNEVPDTPTSPAPPRPLHRAGSGGMDIRV